MMRVLSLGHGNEQTERRNRNGDQNREMLQTDGKRPRSRVCRGRRGCESRVPIREFRGDLAKNSRKFGVALGGNQKGCRLIGDR